MEILMDIIVWTALAAWLAMGAILVAAILWITR